MLERFRGWLDRMKAERDRSLAVLQAPVGEHGHEHAHEDGIVHRHGHDHTHGDHDHDHSHAPGHEH